MNKQTNIYRNYTFYHLADGRILANTPTVGDMIFKDESEFKAYIDGYLITQKFFGEIESELRHAVAKHPKFCDAVLDPDFRMSWAESEYRIKARNAMTKEYSDNILMEEVAEAFNAYQRGDKKKALKEFAQVGAVVLRCMEFIQKEMESEI